MALIRILTQTRVIRDEWSALLAQGIDPQIHRKEQELAQLQNLSNTFYKVTENWRLKYQTEVEPLTMEKNWLKLEKHLFPVLGHYPVTKITPPILIEAVKPLNEKGFNDTLHRIINLANQILNYTVTVGVKVSCFRGSA